MKVIEAGTEPYCQVSWKASTAPRGSPWIASANGGSPCCCSPAAGVATAHRCQPPLPTRCSPRSGHLPETVSASPEDTDTARGCGVPVSASCPAGACVALEAAGVAGRSCTWGPWNSSPDLCSCGYILATPRAGPVSGNRTEDGAGEDVGTAEATVGVTLSLSRLPFAVHPSDEHISHITQTYQRHCTPVEPTSLERATKRLAVRREASAGKPRGLHRPRLPPGVAVTRHRPELQ